MTRTHKLKIDGWRPTSANCWQGCHWSKKHRYKKADREIIAAYALAAGIPRAAGRRKVDLLITLAPRERSPDPDNLWKSTLDGLVGCGLLINDNPQWLELGSVRFRRGAQRRTEIILRDVPF
jgi:hypothetical protein